MKTVSALIPLLCRDGEVHVKVDGSFRTVKGVTRTFFGDTSTVHFADGGYRLVESSQAVFTII